MAPMIMPYPAGLSRGTTPPKDIAANSTGAGNKTNIHPRRLEEMNRGRPFWVADDVPFAQRNTGMALGVLNKSDCPAGPVTFPKDYVRSLMTDDISRARPLIAHPITGTGAPLPFKCLQRKAEDTPTIEKSVAKTHYPFVSDSRPRNLSLTVSDIEYAQPPRSCGVNSEGKGRFEAVDPLCPRYTFASSDARPPPIPRASGKCTMDIADIDGTAPKHQIPYRTSYGDNLKCEDEFRSKSWRRMARGGDSTPRVPVEAEPVQGGYRRRAVEGASPLEPTYAVPMTLNTSLHCRWAEEKSVAGPEPPLVHSEDIGQIEGARSTTRTRDNGEPQLSLETCDISGAGVMRRVGAVPYSIYGPPGARPKQSVSLNTEDISGAQAGTYPRGPRCTHGRTARTGAAIVGTSAGEAPVTTAQLVGWESRPAPVEAHMPQIDDEGSSMGTTLRQPGISSARARAPSNSGTPQMPHTAREPREAYAPLASAIPAERGGMLSGFRPGIPLPH